MAVASSTRSLPGRAVTPGSLRQVERRWGIAFALPAALYFLAFWLFPLAMAIYYSFTNYDLTSPAKWAGLHNYRQMLSSPGFWHSARITVAFTVASVVPTIVLALLIAIPLRRPGRVRSVLRGLLFVPTVMPLVASAIIWQVIYSTDGLANSIVKLAGAEPRAWLTSESLALWSLVIMVVWKQLGLYLLIFMAGLQTLPPSVFEAAAIDGARALRTFFQITLPLLRRALLFVLVIAIIGAMQSFVPAYILTQGGPAAATEVLPLYLYQNAFTFTHMGYASAVAVLLFVVLVALSRVQFRVLGAEEDS